MLSNRSRVNVFVCNCNIQTYPKTPRLPGLWKTQMTGEKLSHSLSHQRPESLQPPSKLQRIESSEEETELVERNMTPNPRAQRYLIAIEYIGTRFSGAQKQLTGRTVVGVLEVPLIQIDFFYLIHQIFCLICVSMHLGRISKIHWPASFHFLLESDCEFHLFSFSIFLFGCNS